MLEAPYPLEPEPEEWPVLVTGAAGFVGGHVARHLAESGHRVRAVSRGSPQKMQDDPEIEWLIGDLRDGEVRRRAVTGVRAVIHTAGWVSLGRDPQGLSRAVNVEATSRLLDDAEQAGVERFVASSTIHTLAAGSPSQPADESSSWNLQSVDSPYSRSKRELEVCVRRASRGNFKTIVLCLGMVIGPRDPKPTSTRLLRTFAQSLVVFLPEGGIPILDALVAAQAHRRALTAGEAGERYAVVGPYLSYPELAQLVAKVVGRPRIIVRLPNGLERLFRAGASLIERFNPGAELSGTTVAGGFLSLHVSGKRGNQCFGLEHPPALDTIRSALIASVNPDSAMQSMREDLG
jgi:dihydroflavonol-4-reductase